MSSLVSALLGLDTPQSQPPLASMIMSNPVGTERIGDQSLTNPTPDVQPAAFWGGQPVSQNLANAVQNGINLALGWVGGTEGGPIRAYHGSPHDFDAFDLSKIGTGEGAQAYGRGLYFAGNEDVARSYRDNLTPANERGNMYEVSVNANPAQLLDWDKPLGQQSMEVQGALQKMGVPPNLAVPGYPYVSQSVPRTEAPGEALYRWLDEKARYEHPNYASGALPPPDWRPDNAGASNALAQNGIPGMQYLDQGSRAAGEGTRNYVMFDPKLIEIVRKYGLAGVLGAGAAAGVRQQ